MSRINKSVALLLGSLFVLAAIVILHIVWPVQASTLFETQTHPVAVQSNFYNPNSLTINSGDIVEWTNVGGFHDVVADDGSFNSGPPSGDPWVFSHTFDKTGTFAYYCSVHGGPGGVGMSGEIIVTGGIPTITPTASHTPTPSITPSPTPTSTPTPSPTPNGVTPLDFLYLPLITNYGG